MRADQLVKIRARFEPQRLAAFARWGVASPGLDEEHPLHATYANQKKLFQSGRVVWGAFIQANNHLYDPALCQHTSHPAMVLYGLDPALDDRGEELVEIARALFEIKETRPDDEEAAAFARVITDERVLGEWQDLPLGRSLSRGHELFTTSVMVHRQHLPTERISAKLFPLLIDRARRAQLVLPFEYWTDELVRMWGSEPERPVNGFMSGEVAAIRRRTGCSDPGFLRLSPKYLARQYPELSPSGLWRMIRWFRGMRASDDWTVRRVADLVLLGDCSPALVLARDPVLVAAYSWELDGVALLQFNDEHLPRAVGANLREGSRLVSLNLDFCLSLGLAPDLTPGPKSYHRYGNFLPTIGNFLSEDVDQLAALEASLSLKPEVWDRIAEMARARPRDLPPRDGRVCHAMQPGGPAITQRWYFEETGTTLRDSTALARWRASDLERDLPGDSQGRVILSVDGGYLFLGGRVVALHDRDRRLIGCAGLWSVREVRIKQGDVWLMLRKPADADAFTFWPSRLMHGDDALLLEPTNPTLARSLFEAVSNRI